MCSNVHKAYFLKLLIEEIREAMAKRKPRSGVAATATSDGPSLPKPGSFEGPVAESMSG